MSHDDTDSANYMFETDEGTTSDTIPGEGTQQPCLGDEPGWPAGTASGTTITPMEDAFPGYPENVSERLADERPAPPEPASHRREGPPEIFMSLPELGTVRFTQSVVDANGSYGFVQQDLPLEMLHQCFKGNPLEVFLTELDEAAQKLVAEGKQDG